MPYQRQVMSGFSHLTATSMAWRQCASTGINMKKIRLCFIFFAAQTLFMGCEESSMCKSNDDCRSMCQTYDNNHIFFSCRENRCICLDRGQMACGEEGDDVKTACGSICSQYAPGSVPGCENNLCTCQYPDEETPAQN